ncbi:hypothetical protein [Fuchsiella alkaliacetigena]|uniref:hypothetical protein n=1 Tax=Fuchsiella alkaliacetigena TaxID=957042 RepID=UPI00200AF234|nr:hypothetical protein [Fuchsiella alkaliacetigena]MCK8825181.1 hypothetical protein [Fuchsiella alkaliacetigena]
MGLVAALILGVLVLYLIAYPILTNDEIENIDYQQRIKSFEEAGNFVDRDVILAEISELELDYHLDNLSEEKYRDFKERLEELLAEKEN